MLTERYARIYDDLHKEGKLDDYFEDDDFNLEEELAKMEQESIANSSNASDWETIDGG